MVNPFRVQTYLARLRDPAQGASPVSSAARGLAIGFFSRLAGTLMLVSVLLGLLRRRAGRASANRPANFLQRK